MCWLYLASVAMTAIGGIMRILKRRSQDGGRPRMNCTMLKPISLYRIVPSRSKKTDGFCVSKNETVVLASDSGLDDVDEESAN